MSKMSPKTSKDTKRELISFEIETVNFYKYYFEGFEKPLIIQANSRIEADILLSDLKNEMDINDLLLLNVMISKPITGVTEKTERGIVYVWAGLNNVPGGWVEKDKF